MSIPHIRHMHTLAFLYDSVLCEQMKALRGISSWIQSQVPGICKPVYPAVWTRKRRGPKMTPEVSGWPWILIMTWRGRIWQRSFRSRRWLLHMARDSSVSSVWSPHVGRRTAKSSKVCLLILRPLVFPFLVSLYIYTYIPVSLVSHAEYTLAILICL